MVKYQSKLSTILYDGYKIDESGLQLNDYIYVRVISKVNQDDFIVIPFVMENGEYLVDLVMEW